jgi:carboxylate-amine ligase
VHAPEVLDENRFLAARDGVEASLVDPVRGHAVALVDVAGELVVACEPHARELGCEAQLALVPSLFGESGAEHQRRLADRGLDGLVAQLAADFRAPRPPDR